MNTESNENGAPSGKHGSRRRGLWGVILSTVVVVGLVGAFAQGAFSSERGWGAWTHEAGYRHHGGMFGGPMEPAEVEERVGKMVAHLAIEIDATDEQEAQLTEIFTGAAADLMALRERAGNRGEAAEELVGLLTAPTVDPAAIEAFRAEKMALADEATQTVATALIGAAEVLSPEQRQEIAEKANFLMKMRRR